MENDLSRVVDALPGIVWTALPDGQIEFLNQPWCEYTGLGMKQSCGQRWQTAVYPDDLPRLLAGWRAGRSPGTAVETEVRLRGRDGKYRWYMFRAQPSTDTSGQIVKWCGLAIKIEDQTGIGKTRNKGPVGSPRTGIAPSESEADAFRIIGSVPGIVVFFMTPEGKHEVISPQIAKYFGKRLEELDQWTTNETVHPEDRSQAVEIFQRAIALGEPYRFEARFRRSDGVYRWFQCRGRPHRDAAGKIARWYCVGIDIDDRKHAEEALRQSEARLIQAERELQLTLDSIPIRVATYDADGTRKSGNKQVRESMGGLPVDQWRARIHPDDLGLVESTWRACLASGVPFEMPYRWQMADGTFRWLMARRVPLRDDTGKVIRWYACAYDIEDQKRAEALLAGEKQLLEMIASGRPVEEILTALCERVEDIARGCLCTIVLVDPSGTKFQQVIGPSLPTEFNEAGRDWPLNRIGGPCVMVARDKVPVIAFDVSSDSRWRTSWRAIAQKHGLKSCWSTPMVSQAGAVLGAFALYQREAGNPTPLQLELIAQFASIASIAIERAQRDDALRQSEARLAEAQRELQLTIDTIPTLVATYRPDGSRIFVNQTWRDYLGLPPDDPVDAFRTGAVHPEDAAGVLEEWQRCLCAELPFSAEMRLRRADGVYRWHTVHRVLARDETGAIVKWYSVAVDIEERKRAEGKAVEAERELQSLLDNIPVSVAAYGVDGNHLYVNKQSVEVTGFSAADLQGDYWKKVNHPEEIESIKREWSACLASGEPFEREIRRRMADGTFRWHLVRRVPVRDGAGKLIRWYGMGVDIEDRKRAEEALRQSEAQLADAKQELQLTIDTIPTLIASYWPNGQRDFVSKNWQEYTGISQEEARGKSSAITFHPDRRDAGENMWQACLASGEPYEADERLRRADGEYRWHWIRRVPLRDESGKIIKWYGVGHDIEHQKQAEAALLNSEARLTEAERELRVTLDSIPTITWRAGANGYVQQLNKRWFEYTGTTHEQVRGWRWKLCVHPDDLDQLVEIGSRYVASGESIDSEARLRRHDGEYRWFLFRPAPVRDEAGNIVAWYGTITDIEDRKRAEEELRRSETLLAEGQRLSLTGTFSWLVDTNRISLSQELHRIFEVEPGAFLTLGLLRERIHPQDRALIDDKVKAVRAGHDTPEYEIRLQMSDHRIKHVRIMGRLLYRQDGRGECLGAIQDITERRLAEEARDKLRSELAHVTRVMSLGALTASIAHEVNQPLAGIVTNASTCLRMLAADPPNVDGARETARRTIRDGNRAADVIARLRALFRKKGAVTEDLDLSDTTREVVALVFSDLLRNRIAVTVELGEEPLPITGDRTQLQQVILNLVRNASDAMSEVNDRPRQLIISAVREKDGGARLIVKDSGVGLEPQSAERLFDAFFTTKVDGMGIGLSVSRSIIESHGGRLWAEANDGPGATFSFSIPRRPEGAGDEGAAGAIWTRPTRGAHDHTRNA